MIRIIGERKALNIHNLEMIILLLEIYLQPIEDHGKKKNRGNDLLIGIVHPEISHLESRWMKTTNYQQRLLCIIEKTI